MCPGRSHGRSRVIKHSQLRSKKICLEKSAKPILQYPAALDVGGRVTGVYAHEWMTGDTGTNTDFWTDSLLDTILRSGSLDAAYKKVHLADAQIPKESVPQGGPLSPICENIMLNELDGELERRGHRYVRYADGCMIMCRSRKRAERTPENIVPYNFYDINGTTRRNQTKVSPSHPLPS